MGNLKYLGTTYDNSKRKLWVKVRNDGDFTEARIRVEFYLEGGFQGSRQKDIKVSSGAEATGEFDYPTGDVDTARVKLTDARTKVNIGIWDVELKPVEKFYGIKGYVKDTEGNPLDFATVDLFGMVRKTTAANGYYNYKFDQVYSSEVTASKSGYKSQTKMVTLKEGWTSVNFELGKEEAPAYPTKVIVEVKNTGAAGDFTVGCTTGTGIGGSGCDLWITGKIQDITAQTIHLNVNETKTLTFNLDPTLYTPGTVYAITKIYANDECLDGDSAYYDF